jgi:hypothetical protein
MAMKSDDERHEEMVASVLAAGIVQQQTFGGGRIQPDAAYIVSFYRQVLTELRRP